MVKWHRGSERVVLRFELLLAGGRTEILTIGHPDVRFKASSRFIGGVEPGVSLHRRPRIAWKRLCGSRKMNYSGIVSSRFEERRRSLSSSWLEFGALTAAPSGVGSPRRVQKKSIRVLTLLRNARINSMRDVCTRVASHALFAASNSSFSHLPPDLAKF